VSHDLTSEVSAALDRVLARFAGMVRAVGARHKLSPSDLDEVMQEVRIRLWRARPTGEQIDSLPTSYIYRTALAAAVDLLRSRRRGPSANSATLDSEDALQVRSARDAMQDVEQREVVEGITRAVEALPDARRAVVRMYLAGYDRHEIAATLRWSEGKTRNLLYRGLADLREVLRQNRSDSDR
jgi:RNA polymerase sigma-70 factor (ECF subfamily)